MTRPASLDLGVTGNCIISALIDREARVVWSCLPRLDGDPVFHALVDDGAANGRGAWSIELAGFERSEQEYVGNTAVLVSRYRQVATFDGRDLSHDMNVTDVWVRRDGRWQIVRRHATLRDR